MGAAAVARRVSYELFDRCAALKAVAALAGWVQPAVGSNQGRSAAAVVIRSSDVVPVILTPDRVINKRLHAELCVGTAFLPLLVSYRSLARFLRALVLAPLTLPSES